MEWGSISSKNMIDMLLNVHALCNMHRASDNDSYRETAAGWIDALESEFRFLKWSLTKQTDE